MTDDDKALDRWHREAADVRTILDRIAAQTAEIERLREALEWAADHVPWLVEAIYERAALGDMQ